MLPANDKGHFPADGTLRMNLPASSVLMTYVARRVLGPFAVLAGVLLFALTLERVLGLVQVVTELKAPIYLVGELVFYLLPHYLGLAIPAAWFLGVLIGLRGLQRDSELTVIRASGIPLRRLLVPLLLVSLGLALVMILLTGYLQPYSRHAYRATLQELKRQDFWSKLEPGVFTSLEQNRSVVRVGAVEDDGHLLKDFSARYVKAGDRHVYVSAREAAVKPLPDGGVDADTQLDLHDGMMLMRDERPGEEARLLNISFDVLSWSLSETGLLPPHGPRGQDEREMTLGELRVGQTAPAGLAVEASRRLTEWHSRLVKCVSVPLLAILAAPLALLGRGRSNKAYGFVIGIVLLVLYQKILGTGESYGKLGELPAGPAVWGPCLILGLLAVVLFHWLGGDRNHHSRRAHRSLR